MQHSAAAATPRTRESDAYKALYASDSRVCSVAAAAECCISHIVVPIVYNDPCERRSTLRRLQHCAMAMSALTVRICLNGGIVFR